MNNDMEHFSNLVNMTHTSNTLRTTPRKRRLGSVDAPVVSETFIRRQKARQEVKQKLRALVFDKSEKGSNILRNVMSLADCGLEVAILRQLLLSVSTGIQVDVEAILDFVVHVHKSPLR